MTEIERALFEGAHAAGKALPMREALPLVATLATFGVLPIRPRALRGASPVNGLAVYLRARRTVPASSRQTAP
jgi:hypothetical protein